MCRWLPQHSILWQRLSSIASSHPSPIAEESFTALEFGEPVTVPFAANMSTVVNQTAQINDKFGNQPGDDRAMVVATVEFEGDVHDEAVAATDDHTLGLSLDRTVYRVTSPTMIQTQHGEPADEVATAAAPSLPARLGGPLALGGGLVGLGVLGVGQATGRFRVSESERAWLAFHEARTDFDEWITTIRLPDAAFERPRAEADSLESLVDLAIDTENRILEDPDREAYYVLYDDYLYQYSKPTRDTQPPTERSPASADPSPDEANPSAVAEQTAESPAQEN